MLNKRLLQLVPNSKKYILAVISLNILSLFCNIIIILNLCNIFRIVITNPNATFNTLLAPILVIFFSAIIRFISSYYSTQSSFNASKNVKLVLREKIYKKLLELGTSYTEKITTSEAIQISTEGVEQLEIYFGQYVPQLFYSVLAPLILFVVLSFICFKAAIILLVCVPLIPVSIIAVQKFAKKLLAKYWKSYTTLGDSFLENIQGLTTLKIYSADAEKHKQMNEKAENFRKVTMKVLTMQLNSIIVMDIVAYGGSALGIIIAGFEYWNGNISLFSALAVILLSADFFIPLRLLGSFFHVAMNGISASDKIFKLLDTPVDEKPINKPLVNTDIEITNLSYTYKDGNKILDNVSLSIPNKNFIAISGKSGCGKSTIAAILSGRLSNYLGTVKIGGIELSSLSEKVLNENITLVNHNSYIFKGTFRYNLLFANPTASDEEMFSVLKAVNLYDFVMSQNGLDTEINEQGSNLSGGQRQRLGVARALLHNTPIYIFDEVTSNIDSESEEMIMNVIQKLSNTKTVIVISHRLKNIVTADKIYHINNKKIDEFGTHKYLLSLNKTYSELYTNQQQLENYLIGGVNNA